MSQEATEGSIQDVSVRQSSARPPNPLPSTSKPTVHRCRFVDYAPGTITALAVTPDTWNPELYFGFPHLQKSRGALAVGRGNGDLEIWVWLPSDTLLSNASGRKKSLNSSGPNQGWILYRTLPGHIPFTSSSRSAPASKIEQLVFSHQINPVDGEDSTKEELDREISTLTRALPRLFGTNGGDEVLEWEWEGTRAGTIKRTLAMPPSVAIWSLAVCPQSNTLAIGCDDGTIRLATIRDNQFDLMRKFDPCKSKLLSVAWGTIPSKIKTPNANSKKNKNSKNSKDFLVAGCADSGLRKWDTKSGRCISRMVVDKLQGEPTLVWTVSVLEKFIVSGDSLGNINFWDLNTCARFQTVRAHRADILCLVPSPDGQEIFTSGVDQKTCQLTLINNHNDNDGKAVDDSRWILSTSRRLHSHDVRALAMSPPYVSASSEPNSPASSGKVSPVPVLISGGLDMSLVLCSAASPTPYAQDIQRGNPQLPANPISDSSVIFRDSMQRKISYATRRQPVTHLAQLSRLLVCRRDRGISIWRLPPRGDLGVAHSYSRSCLDSPETAWNKVVDMELKCQTNLVASAISPDGKWLAVSDLYQAKLFYLTRSPEGDLQPKRVKSFSPSITPFTTGQKQQESQEGACVLSFSPDSTRLFLATCFSAKILVIGLDEEVKECQVLRVFHQHQSSRTHSHQNVDRRVVIPQSQPSTVNDTQDDGIEDDSGNADGGNVVTGIAISPDCQWLASVDSGRVLHIFNLDLLKHHCLLPTSSTIINCLSFSSVAPSTLVVGYANNSLQVMDVETRRMPEWAHSLCSTPPNALAQLRDAMLGIFFEPQVEREERSSGTSSVGSETRTQVAHAMFLYGANWTCKIDLPDPSISLASGVMSRRLKRPRHLTDLGSVTEEPEPGLTSKAEAATAMGSLSTTLVCPEAAPGHGLSNAAVTGKKVTVRVTHKYQSVLLCEFLGVEEMVIVERPFFGLLAGLPAAWSRNGAYGT